MFEGLEEFEKSLQQRNESDPVKRKKQQCPSCKEILLDAYIEQNPFPEIPCSSCGTLISITSIQDVEIEAINERTDPRCDASLKVTYQSVNDFIIEYTKNVSRGGMFINTKRLHEIGSHVNVGLHVPGLAEPVKLTAEVVHIKFLNVRDEDAGIGVKFIDIDEHSRQALITFIKSQENCS